MDKNSPWYSYHPDSLGWLHRRHAAGELILSADVMRIIEADPEADGDPLFLHYREKAERGELKGKRGPRYSSARQLKHLYAELLVEDLAPRLAARRARQGRKGIRKTRSQYGPRELALVVVANHLGFGGWESLRNVLNLRRRRSRNSVTARVH